MNYLSGVLEQAKYGERNAVAFSCWACNILVSFSRLLTHVNSLAPSRVSNLKAEALPRRSAVCQRMQTWFRKTFLYFSETALTAVVHRQEARMSA